MERRYTRSKNALLAFFVAFSVFGWTYSVHAGDGYWNVDYRAGGGSSVSCSAGSSAACPESNSRCDTGSSASFGCGSCEYVPGASGNNKYFWHQYATCVAANSFCTGYRDPNAIIYPGDDGGQSYGSETLMYSSTNTSRSCEWYCKTGYAHKTGVYRSQDGTWWDGCAPMPGVCGSENGRTIGDGGPDYSKLCSSGDIIDYAPVIGKPVVGHVWHWKCGSTACSASYGSGSGSGGGGGSTTVSCGSNNGATFPGGGPPSDKNCVKNGAPDPAHSFGARMQNGYWVGWDWTCGSGNVSCGATLSPGGCGSANGTTVSSAPSTPTELCKKGSSSGVSGTGPWNWTCSGTSCSAAKTGSTVASCGPASGQTFATTEDADARSSGKHCIKNGGPIPYANFSERKDASGNLTGWTWKCEDASCSANKSTAGGGGGGTGTTIKIDGSCGSAARNYTETETALSGSLCYTGIPDPINASFPQDDAPVAWTCKGMTGGQDSATCRATRGNSATIPGACSLYTATSSLPEGYGSPFNQLSTAKEPTLTVSCGTNGSIATSESATVATAGSQATYTYKTGFASENGQWKKIDFSGMPMSNNEGWFQGSALSNISSPPAGGANFVIAFVCQYQNNAWKCGCRDSACTQNYWTIQSYGTSFRL